MKKLLARVEGSTQRIAPRLSSWAKRPVNHAEEPADMRDSCKEYVHKSMCQHVILFQQGAAQECSSPWQAPSYHRIDAFLACGVDADPHNSDLFVLVTDGRHEFVLRHPSLKLVALLLEDLRKF